MDWFEILEMCRSLGPEGTRFKHDELQALADFPDTFDRRGAKKSSGLQKASSWCAKLTKMKLLEQAGQDDKKTGPGRKGYYYKVSEAGWKDKEKPLSRLDRLLEAINNLKASHGRPEEGKLYAKLFEVAAQVEREMPLDKKKRKGE